MKQILKLCFVSLFVLGLLGQANADNMGIKELNQSECSVEDGPYCQPIVSGDLEAVKKLIDDKVDVNIQAIYNITPLHYAAMCGDVEIAELLIASGAKVNVGPYTPLHAATDKNHLSTAEYLIDKGAKVNSVDLYGKTPLDYTQQNDIRIREMLLRHGAKSGKDLK